jgi:hypothetical protein
MTNRNKNIEQLYTEEARDILATYATLSSEALPPIGGQCIFNLVRAVFAMKPAEIVRLVARKTEYYQKLRRWLLCAGYLCKLIPWLIRNSSTLDEVDLPSMDVNEEGESFEHGRLVSVVIKRITGKEMFELIPCRDDENFDIFMLKLHWLYCFSDLIEDGVDLASDIRGN